ncbi:unnamed protein product [Nippostrongylus brasiliensis]|uniref:5'-nucleotidase n=1 Tax=Nippostrongylus brasiliensis TaxID=27835 RepID=A0A0N4XPU7_NIPBR|nr:unnamed protein product [Nippostrongylus brasiliensis]
MEATISSIMNHRSVHMRDRANVEKKLRHLISGGDRQFAVISDFDFTLTRFVDERGNRCLTSHSVVDQLLISLHPELEEMIHARTKKYSAIEFDTNMTKEDKIPYMIEWWTLAHNNYIASGIHKDDIERAVQHSKIELR